jgi:hypothetical protein
MSSWVYSMMFATFLVVKKCVTKLRCLFEFVRIKGNTNYRVSPLNYNTRIWYAVFLLNLSSVCKHKTILNKLNLSHSAALLIRHFKNLKQKSKFDLKHW